MKLRLVISIVVIGTLAVLTLYGIRVFTRIGEPTSLSEEATATSTFNNNSGIHADWATNFRDNRKLVGFVQDIFAGKVIRQIGSSAPYGLAHIQYEVEVIYNIKGDASGIVMVDIEVGNGDELTPGATYLLSSLHFESLDPGYYVGAESVFRTSVSENRNLSNAQLKELVLRHSRTYELLSAYVNEIPFDVHMAKGINANAFASFSETEKQAIVAKFQELIPSRAAPEMLVSPPSPVPSQAVENTSSRCHDGADNDNDGLSDKADPDCKGFFREDLAGLCKDQDDTDADGLVDAADPDCAPFYPKPAPPSPPPPPPASTSTPLTTPPQTASSASST